MDKTCITDWPGKTFKGFSPDTHPALWHMLDVAAVAVELAQEFAIDRIEAADADAADAKAAEAADADARRAAKIAGS